MHPPPQRTKTRFVVAPLCWVTLMEGDEKDQYVGWGDGAGVETSGSPSLTGKRDN
jgi:hypothetical protein